MRIPTLLLGTLFVFFAFSAGVQAGPKIYPVVKVSKSMEPLDPDKKGINIQESASITIKLEGDTVETAQGVETAVVILLDESGSMENLAQYTRQAAKSVVQLVKANDQVGLVTFSDEAHVHVPLTLQHADIINAIDGLDDPGGLTNAKDGFDKANKVLLQSLTAIKRFVIFFTDGEPTPITQIDDITADGQKEFLNQHQINYFTVAYGNFTKEWLKNLAQNSGGEFCDASSTANISSCFQSAWSAGSTKVSAQQVVLTEVLSPDFEPVGGSAWHSAGGNPTSEPGYFKQAMENAKIDFYKSGTFLTPAIYELPAGRTFSVGFKVRPKTCQPELTELGVDDVAKTKVTYKYGNSTIPIAYPSFNQVKVPVQPCGVYVSKTFEEVNRVITITLNNTFQDRNIFDVHVIEILGEHVSANAGAAAPFEFGSLGQVVWPHYPPYSDWNTDGVEWRFFDCVPDSSANAFPPFGYQVTRHSYIGPNSSLVLTLPVDAKSSAEGQSPVVINKERPVSIERWLGDGASISFWYYVQHPAERVSHEVVGTFNYHYSYESPSAPTDADYKRHVMIYLPRLEVQQLPPLWPYK